MRERKDPFRTLDDPEPAETIAPAPCEGNTPSLSAAPAPVLLQEAHSLGYWQMWPAGRPSRLRRLLVRLVLGWKWRE
jgi:hypothetical protein